MTPLELRPGVPGARGESFPRVLTPSSRAVTRPGRFTRSRTRLDISCRDSSDAAGWASTVAGAGRGRRLDAAEYLSQRAALLPELLRDVGQIVLRTGNKGVARTAQAIEAVLWLAREQLGRPGGVESPPRVLRRLFERLGATYIKLGQFIASSPTLFPEEYVVEFQACLDRTTPVPFEVVRRRIQGELGRPVDAVFEKLEPEPIASASVAQVHEAVLKDSGKRVAVKVLKPGVEDVLTADLNFLYVASRVLEFLTPDLSRASLSAIVGDIRNTITEEVDFTKEAEHIAHFRNYLDSTGMGQLATCPFVYKQLSTSKVLTMDYLDGVPLTDLDSIRQATSADPEQTLIAALNTWTGSLLGAETFHADVHAGNLLVLRDGKIGFIDFGIVGRISPVTWNAISTLVQAIGTEDYATMAKALATMGATDEAVDVAEFANDLRGLFDELKELDPELVVERQKSGATISAQVAVDEEQINSLLLKIVNVSDTHGIRFPREFGLLIKQMLYFDRYVRILAPRLKVLTDDRVNISNMSGDVSAKFRI